MNIWNTVKKMLSQFLDYLIKDNRDTELVDFEYGVLTLRELLVSIVIICIFSISGLFISDRIQNSISESNQIYLHATEIDSPSLFDYAIRTEVGNAFVLGDLIAVDPVTIDNKGPYLYIKKRTEKYTMHTRVVTHSDGKRTWTTTEVYYTWDYYAQSDWHCNKINFCGKEFNYDAIAMPGHQYLCTDYEQTWARLRHIYYATPSENKGVLFTNLINKQVSHGQWFDAESIQQAKDSCITSSKARITAFWFVWIIITVACVFIFCTFDNNWLN